MHMARAFAILAKRYSPVTTLCESSHGYERAGMCVKTRA